eukprot:PITA_05878
MFPSWFMVAIGATGMSGGLAVLWDPTWIKARAFKCCAGIMISALVRGHANILNILNFYGPCRDRAPFWERLFMFEILEMESLLIAGDLNFTLSPNECWGTGRKKDPLSDRIRMELLNKNLVDICPENMGPTWENGRNGLAFIAKRIDRFLIKENIIDNWGLPISSISNVYLSDHKPILLEWRTQQYRKDYYFKFNKSFLEESSFNDEISKIWGELAGTEDATSITFCGKISRLKKYAKEWQHQKIIRDRQELIHIQKALDAISSSSPHMMSFDKRTSIRALEKRRNHLLSIEEATWRLKSRALWLKDGDHNTKFFQNFANARKRKNAIWKIDDGKGGLFHSQEGISYEASRVFKEEYKRVQTNAMIWEHHNFLKERNIWDAVALTQECLFSLRSKNTKDVVLKVDLKKAYDCVDWGFLRILLAKIGFCRIGIEWIMACVENINFSIIINGSASPFFKAERGLRQGCPLSPLLFILVMNTLNIQLNRDEARFCFRPIKLAKDFFLSHNLFVDDILVFSMLHKASWQCLFIIFDRFQSASGICINKEKSKIFHNDSEAERLPGLHRSLVSRQCLSIVA